MSNLNKSPSSEKIDGAVDFLLRWASEAGAGVITLCAIDPVSGSIKSCGFYLSQDQKIQEFVGKYMGHWNLYFGPNVPQEPTNKKLSEKDVHQVVCIHVDIDPRDGEPFELERKRILGCLEAFIPAPTVIVDSGGGYQAFWLLRAPLAAADHGQQIKALNAAIAKKLGGDKCHSLDHVMRLPGTINIPNQAKAKKGRARAPAQLVRFSDARYAAEDFKHLLVDNGPNEFTVSVTAEQLRPLDIEALNLPRPLVTLIRTGQLPHDPDRFASRSEALFAAMVGLLGAGLNDEQILSILTDEENAISEKPLEKKKALVWLSPQLTKARRHVAAATERYRATKNGFVLLSPVKGELVPASLTNFTATIVAEHVRDDGSAGTRRSFVIEGELANGTKLPRIEVPAAEFEQLKWIAEKWGSSPVIMPQRMHRDHTATAIRTLSPPRQLVTMHLHTGWKKIDGRYVYLHAEGGIGAEGPVPEVLVDLSESMKDFRLEIPGDPVADIRASLELAALGKGKIGYPLLASIYRSILGEFSPVTFSIFLEGGSGTFKSSVSALAQAHFGRNWVTSNLPANWQSTENALEHQAFLAKDALLVVDDFTPSGNQHNVSRLHATAERLLRGQGNLSGRQRLKADASFRASFHPRGLIISSGEDVPEGKSLGARMLIVSVEPGDVDPALLTRLQSFALEGAFVRSVSGFIQWVAGRAAKLPDLLQKRSAELRSEVVGDHRRTPENAASALLGIEEFLKYAECVGAITSGEVVDHMNRARSAIDALAHEQTAHIRNEDAATRYIDYLGSALRMGRAHLADIRSDIAPANAIEVGWISEDKGLRASGDCVGWVEGQSVYLDAKPAMAVVQRIARESSDNVGFKAKALHRELRNAGFIKSADQGRNLLLKTVRGRRLPVVHLDLGDLIGGVDPGRVSTPLTGVRRYSANSNSRPF